MIARSAGYWPLTWTEGLLTGASGLAILFLSYPVQSFFSA